jgi:hypothetical protein
MNPFPKISFSCPVPWANLPGDERARFCEQCGHTVTNLSEMSEEDRKAFLAKSGGERRCVTYYRRMSGEFVTPKAPLSPEERSRVMQLGLAALSAGALAMAAGCVTTPVEKKEDKKPLVQAKAAQGDEEVLVLQPFGVIADESPSHGTNPAAILKLWTTRVDLIHVGMRREEVERILTSPAAGYFAGYVRATTITGSSQGIIYYVAPGLWVTVFYDYTGVPRDSTGRSLAHESPENRVIAPPKLEQRSANER